MLRRKANGLAIMVITLLLQRLVDREVAGAATEGAFDPHQSTEASIPLR
ncbi:hypothetical protein [Rivibacter subsaxonicus]|nr:hypothetical protein [Rivibacter subsaxonicus]